MGVNRYLIVVLICMSLRLMLTIFSLCIFGEICLSPLLNFLNWVCFFVVELLSKSHFVNDLNLLSENFNGS